MDKMQKKEVSNFGCASFISLVIGAVYLFIGIKYLGLSETQKDNVSDIEITHADTTQTTTADSNQATGTVATEEDSEHISSTEEVSDETLSNGVENNTDSLTFHDYFFMVDNQISITELFELLGKSELCYYNNDYTSLVFTDCPVRVFVSPGYDEINQCIPDDSHVIGIISESTIRFTDYGYESAIIIGETTVDDLEYILDREIELDPNYSYYDADSGTVFCYYYYPENYWNDNGASDCYVTFYIANDVIISADYFINLS